MSSRTRRKGVRKDAKQRERGSTANDSTAESSCASDSTHAPQKPLSALANDDPSTLSAIFEPSKIKNFLYKAEPKMARINASSLDLVSTTATVLLKTLVEKAVLLEQEDRMGKMKRKEDRDIYTNDDHILVTSNRLKSVLESTNDPSALDFLEETYENFRDKDGSFLPSKLSEYVPRTAQQRKPKAKKPSTARVLCTTTIPEQADGALQAESAGHKAKRPKRNHTYRESPSSLLLSSECANGTGPVQKAIAQAVAATGNYAPDQIIEDEDDYD